GDFLVDLLVKHEQVRIQYTPTYSSWLNQVENWFSRIRRDVISRGIFTSIEDLDRNLMRYIREYNKDARPLKWKYDDPASGHHQFFGFRGLDPLPGRSVPAALPRFEGQCARLVGRVGLGRYTCRSPCPAGCEVQSAPNVSGVTGTLPDSMSATGTSG